VKVMPLVSMTRRIVVSLLRARQSALVPLHAGR
jgi:hypothetical protein